MANDDSLYHGLFAHPVLVRQLLEAFVPADLLEGLDPDGMERVNVSFHEALKDKRRTGDVIWRLPARDGGSVHLCVLLEFQASDVRLMAVRVMVYQGLLWQQLAAEGRLEAGRLPPVLSLVVYNGEERWRSPEGVEGLVGLPAGSPLWPWQPQARYHLLDMGARRAEAEARPGNLAALLVRLEDGQDDPAALGALVDEVIAWFREHPGHDELMELFAMLVREAVRGFDPPMPVPNDMKEMRIMLATQGQRWIEKWKAEGEATGRAELLLRLLRRRFDTVPGELESLVRAADVAQIDAWSDRLLDARTLDDVFAADRPN